MYTGHWPEIYTSFNISLDCCYGHIWYMVYGHILQQNRTYSFAAQTFVCKTSFWKINFSTFIVTESRNWFIFIYLFSQQFEIQGRGDLSWSVIKRVSIGIILATSNAEIMDLSGFGSHSTDKHFLRWKYSLHKKRTSTRLFKYVLTSLLG